MHEPACSPGSSVSAPATSTFKSANQEMIERAIPMSSSTMAPDLADLLRRGS